MPPSAASVAALEERLAAVRAAKAEQERIERRLAGARADRRRLTDHLAAVDAVLETADHGALRAGGIGGFFRRLVGGGDLAVDQQELTAARLQREALVDELRATDVDLAQLEMRHASAAATVADYPHLVAEAEAALLRMSSPHADAIARLAERDARVAAARREVAEAIAAGIAAQEQFVIVQAIAAEIRENHRTDTDTLGFLGPALAVGAHGRLKAALGPAQHALAAFQRECRDVMQIVEGIALSALPTLPTLLAQEFLWTTSYVRNAASEIDLLSSYVVSTTLELRGRDQELAAEAAVILDERAAIVAPIRERL